MKHLLTKLQNQRFIDDQECSISITRFDNDLGYSLVQAEDQVEEAFEKGNVGGAKDCITEEDEHESRTMSNRENVDSNARRPPSRRNQTRGNQQQQLFDDEIQDGLLFTQNHEIMATSQTPRMDTSNFKAKYSSHKKNENNQ